MHLRRRSERPGTCRFNKQASWTDVVHRGNHFMTTTAPDDPDPILYFYTGFTAP
jgi:hypothetical protein